MLIDIAPRKKELIRGASDLTTQDHDLREHDLTERSSRHGKWKKFMSQMAWKPVPELLAQHGEASMCIMAVCDGEQRDHLVAR